MKKLLAISLLIIAVSVINAQEFTVPRNYSFKTQRDYKKYEPDILKCIDYLENAPVNDLSENRKKINSFFMDWVSGTESVHIVISSYVMDYWKVNNNFLIIFIAGWTKHSLNNPNEDDLVKGNLAGIEAIIRVYQKNNGVTEDKKIVELIKLQNEGKLENWIRQALEK